MLIRGRLLALKQLQVIWIYFALLLQAVSWHCLCLDFAMLSTENLGQKVLWAKHFLQHLPLAVRAGPT